MHRIPAPATFVTLMDTYQPPPDLVLHRTGDGSATLRSEQLGEQYHSLHGAVQESRHVFIEAGLNAVTVRPVSILEVGLGTGLNALLTWVTTEQNGVPVEYAALEPWPLSPDVLRELDHPRLLGRPDLHEGFIRMMTNEASQPQHISRTFSFTQRRMSVCDLDEVDRYDLVYFDAFGPATQPELWNDEVFRRVFRAMRQSAALVTYCAKGEVRRAMRRAGFDVERLPGPPGKREMLRAMRSSRP